MSKDETNFDEVLRYTDKLSNLPYGWYAVAFFGLLIIMGLILMLYGMI